MMGRDRDFHGRCLQIKNEKEKSGSAEDYCIHVTHKAVVYRLVHFGFRCLLSLKSTAEKKSLWLTPRDLASASVQNENTAKDSIQKCFVLHEILRFSYNVQARTLGISVKRKSNFWVRIRVLYMRQQMEQGGGRQRKEEAGLMPYHPWIKKLTLIHFYSENKE